MYKKITDITNGFYLDSGFTNDKIGLGVAKNILEQGNIKIDVGAYMMTKYNDLFGFKPVFNPAVGLSIKF